MMMYGNDNYSTSQPTCSRWSHAWRSLNMGKNNDGLLYQCHLLVLVGVTLGDPTKMQLSNYDKEYAFYVHYADKFSCFCCCYLLYQLDILESVFTMPKRKSLHIPKGLQNIVTYPQKTLPIKFMTRPLFLCGTHSHTKEKVFC